MVWLSIGVERIPNWQWHTEEPLTADKPVTIESLNPIFVSVTHVVGVPSELVTPIDERMPGVDITASVRDVPLAASDNFERAITAFIEFNWVFEWSRLANEFLRIGQHLNNFALSLLDVETRYFCVGIGVHPCWWFGDDPAVTANDGSCGQLQFAPPNDVGEVTEGTDHCDAGAFVGLGKLVGNDGNFDAVERR